MHHYNQIKELSTKLLFANIFHTHFAQLYIILRPYAQHASDIVDWKGILD
jgi:hypothetical protein